MKVKQYKSGDIAHKNIAIKGIPITLRDKPHAMVETMRGLITYQEWLESEKLRIEARGGQASIRSNGDKIQLIREDAGIYDNECILRYDGYEIR